MLGKIQVVPCNPKILHLCKDNHCGSVNISYPQQFIVNAFAQGSYGFDGKQYTDLNALEKCFKSIQALTHEKNNNNGATIAMPWKIGMYKFNAKQTTNNIINWIQDWFSENGPDCKAVIGISGGKDSSIVAALCVEALGKDRVYGVLMPNGVQNDIDVASRLCKFLGIDYGIFDISGAVDSIRRKVKTALDDHWSVQSSYMRCPRQSEDVWQTHATYLKNGLVIVPDGVIPLEISVL